ncbi:MAG: VOC family protein [Anaerolineae bacterium]
MTHQMTPQLNIRYLYAFCNEIDPMREFYSDVLGMQEGSHMDSEDFGWLTYKSEGLELMFFRWDDGVLPVQQAAAWQPGGGDGELPVMSFSVHVPRESYAATVERLRASGANLETAVPTWRQESYWGLTARDPMGYTVEVYSDPAEKPVSTEWPGS